MSQWTYTVLTQNDAYYPYSKQVAYHAISYFSSMFLLVNIRIASSMHCGVKQCIPHVHQILVWKYTSVYLKIAARGRWTWFRYSYIRPHEFMYNTHWGWFGEILALYSSLLPLTQHFYEEWQFAWFCAISFSKGKSIYILKPGQCRYEKEPILTVYIDILFIFNTERIQTFFKFYLVKA